MKTEQNLRELIELLTYSSSYGPDDYPEEDGTSLEEESRLISQYFSALEEAALHDDLQGALRVARVEFESALAAFGEHDEVRGQRLLDDAAQRLRRRGRGSKAIALPPLED